MIRHALAPAACPVGPVPVAVIVPSLRAFLVFTLGGPNLLPARFLPAAETAVFVAPVTMTADPEHPATVGPPAKPLTQWLFTGPHRRVCGGPEQPRQSMASGILSTDVTATPNRIRSSITLPTKIVMLLKFNPAPTPATMMLCNTSCRSSPSPLNAASPPTKLIMNAQSTLEAVCGNAGNAGNWIYDSIVPSNNDGQ